MDGLTSSPANAEDLEEFFAAARARSSERLPGHLESRILADAARLQPATFRKPVGKERIGSFLDAVSSIFSWQAAGALAAATAVGVAIGLSSAELVEEYIAGYGVEIASIDAAAMPDIAALLMEG